jgi:hypothetical protein
MILGKSKKQISDIVVKVLVKVVSRHLNTLGEVSALLQFQNLSNFLELSCVLSEASKESLGILDEFESTLCTNSEHRFEVVTTPHNAVLHQVWEVFHSAHRE